MATSITTTELKIEAVPNDVAKVPPETQLPTEGGVELGPSEQPSDTTALDEFQDNSQVPQYSPFRLFWFFLWRFGLFAWGGPVAQIALIKEELVIKYKWITIA
jgi:hypothetical protein